MSEHHDHRDDCPFKFATLDVCDCVEKNMLDRIEALTAENARLERVVEDLSDEVDLAEQEACMLENDFIKADKEIDNLKAKLAKAVEALEVIRDRQYYRMGPGITAQVIARATWAEIEGSDAP